MQNYFICFASSNIYTLNHLIKFAVDEMLEANHLFLKILMQGLIRFE